jgi:hypothetical protein
MTTRREDNVGSMIVLAAVMIALLIAFFLALMAVT